MLKAIGTFMNVVLSLVEVPCDAIQAFVSEQNVR